LPVFGKKVFYDILVDQLLSQKFRPLHAVTHYQGGFMLGLGLEEIVVAVAVVLVFAVPGKMPSVAKNEVKQKPSLQTYLKSHRTKS